MANLQRRRLLTMGLTTGAFAMLPMKKALAAAWAQEHTQILNHVELGLIEVQDSITAASTTISAAMDEINMYLNTLMQFPDMVMSKLGLDKVFQTIGTFTAMYSKLQGLFGSLFGMKDQVQSRLQAFAATGLDWRSYAQREAAMSQNIRDRHSLMNESERAALKQVNDNYEDIQEFQRQNSATLGTHGSLRLLNSQMAQLNSITNSVYGLQAQTQYIERATEQDRFERTERIKKESEELYNSENKSLRDAAKTLQDWRP